MHSVKSRQAAKGRVVEGARRKTCKSHDGIFTLDRNGKLNDYSTRHANNSPNEKKNVMRACTTQQINLSSSEAQRAVLLYNTTRHSLEPTPRVESAHGHPCARTSSKTNTPARSPASRNEITRQKFKRLLGVQVRPNRERPPAAACASASRVAGRRDVQHQQ